MGAESRDDLFRGGGRLLRRKKGGSANQLQQACIGFFHTSFLCDRLGRRRFHLSTIICNDHGRLFVERQRPVIFDPDADRPASFPRQSLLAMSLLSPRSVRKPPSISTAGTFVRRSTANRARLIPRSQLGDMSEHRMINASRECETLRIHRTAGLRVSKLAAGAVGG